MVMRKLLLVSLGVMVGGCASTWERNFEPRAEVPAASRAPAGVVVREVPWNRLEKAHTELAAMLEGSDVHWDEWPEDRKREADAKLIKALQISEDPAQVEIVGRSSFKTTDKVRPTDGSLEKFAASVGADYAIWADKYLGKADKVVQEPVRETGFRPTRYYDRSRGRYTTRHEFDDWTTYVPVVVRADETAWVVYFLRRTGQ